jgi:hypothetical protein
MVACGSVLGPAGSKAGSAVCARPSDGKETPQFLNLMKRLEEMSVERFQADKFSADLHFLELSFMDLPEDGGNILLPGNSASKNNLINSAASVMLTASRKRGRTGADQTRGAELKSDFEQFKAKNSMLIKLLLEHQFEDRLDEQVQQAYEQLWSKFQELVHKVMDNLADRSTTNANHTGLTSSSSSGRSDGGISSSSSISSSGVSGVKHQQTKQALKCTANQPSRQAPTFIASILAHAMNGFASIPQTYTQTNDMGDMGEKAARNCAKTDAAVLRGKDSNGKFQQQQRNGASSSAPTVHGQTRQAVDCDPLYKTGLDDTTFNGRWIACDLHPTDPSPQPLLGAWDKMENALVDAKVTWVLRKLKMHLLSSVVMDVSDSRVDVLMRPLVTIFTSWVINMSFARLADKDMEAKIHPAPLSYPPSVEEQQYLWINHWWRVQPAVCTVSAVAAPALAAADDCAGEGTSKHAAPPPARRTTCRARVVRLPARYTAGADIPDLASPHQSEFRPQAPQQRRMPQIHTEWTTYAKLHGPVEGMGVPPPVLISHVTHLAATYEGMKSMCTFRRSWTWTLVDENTMDLDWRLTFPPHGGGNSWGEPIGCTVIRYKRIPQ